MTGDPTVGELGHNQGNQELRARPRMKPTATLVKSKQRVADHGEVFTPDWLVEDMLDLVKDETERIDSRVLEPACASGNFEPPRVWWTIGATSMVGTLLVELQVEGNDGDG